MVSTMSGQSMRLRSTQCEFTGPDRFVSRLRFSFRYNTFASGGSDGMVSLWDHYAKKRLKQIPRQASAVTALAYSPSGDKLAIGVSYCWDDGEAGLKKERDKNKGQVVQVRIKHIGDDGKVGRRRGYPRLQHSLTRYCSLGRCRLRSSEFQQASTAPRVSRVVARTRGLFDVILAFANHLPCLQGSAYPRSCKVLVYSSRKRILSRTTPRV